jgi:hypothetical protein
VHLFGKGIKNSRLGTLFSKKEVTLLFEETYKELGDFKERMIST